MEEFTEKREKSSDSERKPRRYSEHSRRSSFSRSRSRSRSRRKSSSHRHRRSRSRRRCRCASRSRSPSYHRRRRYYGTRENPNKSRVLGVFGLSCLTSEHTLMDVFGKFGPIEHISIIVDAKTGNSRGFGFIYFTKIEHATEARGDCNGSTLDGKRIRVDYSITKRAHTPTPGIYMGSPQERFSRRRSHSSSKRRRSRYSYSRSRSHSRSYR
jgi:transformer-2 protein